MMDMLETKHHNVNKYIHFMKESSWRSSIKKYKKIVKIFANWIVHMFCLPLKAICLSTKWMCWYHVPVWTQCTCPQPWLFLTFLNTEMTSTSTHLSTKASSLCHSGHCMSNLIPNTIQLGWYRKTLLVNFNDSNITIQSSDGVVFGLHQVIQQ